MSRSENISQKDLPLVSQYTIWLLILVLSSYRVSMLLPVRFRGLCVCATPLESPNHLKFQPHRLLRVLVVDTVLTLASFVSKDDIE